MDGTLANIVSQAISGVAAGIILAIAFGIMDALQRRRERKVQAKFISDMIWVRAYAVLELFSIDTSHIGVDSTVIMDGFRKNLFESFRENMIEVLSRRSSRLTFDEIEMIRNGLFRYYDECYKDKDKAPSKEWYIETFSRLKEIGWLDMSKCPNEILQMREASKIKWAWLRNLSRPHTCIGDRVPVWRGHAGRPSPFRFAHA